jgi:hypothetical protein
MPCEYFFDKFVTLPAHFAPHLAGKRRSDSPACTKRSIGAPLLVCVR